MTIKYEVDVKVQPIKAAHLDTANGAELHAHLDEHSDASSHVAFTEDDLENDADCGWYFAAPACREAATFFTSLAEDLEAR